MTAEQFADEVAARAAAHASRLSIAITDHTGVAGVAFSACGRYCVTVQITQVDDDEDAALPMLRLLADD